MTDISSSGSVLMRLLRNLGRTTPEIQPFVLPVVGLYMLFLFFSWTAVPLFNLLLFLNRHGRLSLNEERIKHWLDHGALPSERVARLLGEAGVIAMPATPN